MMLPNTKLQVSMFKDLVTLASPTNKFSFVSYLHQHGRLFQYLNSDFNQISRLEFADYLKWAATSNKNICFGERVENVDFDGNYFVVDTSKRRVFGKNIVIGAGITPHVPQFAKEHIDSESHFHIHEFARQERDFSGKKWWWLEEDSLGRPSYDDIAQHEELDRYLVENNITLLFGLGLEPGLVEILMQYVAWQQGSKSLTCLRSVCGGVPLNPTPPLNYDLLFGDRLPSLNRRALFKLNGSLSYCNRFDICERSFVDGVGMLEVFHDGLSPYLLSSPYIKDIPNIKQQTARWPGFFECMRTLIALGLLEDAPTLAGDLVPNDLTHSILMQNGNLKRNGPDISFVEVTGEFASGGEVKVSLVSTWDEESNLTGMAKLTSFMVT